MLFVAQLYHFYADIYSLEYGGVLYMFCVLSSSVWQAC
jgi:hypothetical protein